MADFSMEGAEDLPDYDPDGESDEHSPVEAQVSVPAASLPAAPVPAPPGAGATDAAAGAQPAKPGGTSAVAVAAPASAPVFQDGLPADSDGERWLEFLRDGYMRQLREEAELPEPPPFQRALQFVAPPGQMTPEGYYPRQALNHQLHLVRRLHWEGDWNNANNDRWSDRSRGAPYGHRWGGGWGGHGGHRAGMVPPSWATGPGMRDADAHAVAMLPQLLGQLQAGGVDPSVLVQVSQQAQAGQLNGLLSEVAKKLAATRRAAARAARGGDVPGAGPGAPATG